MNAVSYKVAPWWGVLYASKTLIDRTGVPIGMCISSLKSSSENAVARFDFLEAENVSLRGRIAGAAKGS